MPEPTTPGQDASAAAVEQEDEAPALGPPGLAAGCFVIGIALGLIGGAAQGWLIAAGVVVLVGIVLFMMRRPHAALPVLFIALTLTAAAWCAVRQRHVADDDVRHYVTAESQLAEFVGVIATPPALTSQAKGAFADFSYKPPGTLFVLDIESPVTGRVLVKIEEAEHRLRIGDRVRVTGWLSRIEGPLNPGEFNWAAAAADQGVYGRLTLAARGNCKVIGVARRSLLTRFRRTLSDGASTSLAIGMDPTGEARGLLDALLLGRRGGLPAELDEAFRRTGLAHLLSISGAHLGILIWVAWLIARGVTRHPRTAAAAVGVVLIAYLLVVPSRVPIIRAGIMAGLLLAGEWSGRRLRAIDLLLVSAMIVLIWRPNDLTTAGFQLSFGVVAALLLFTRPVAQLLWRPFESPLIVETTGYWFARRGADYVAVNLVAFLTAAPMVLFHFKVFTPLTIGLSIIALPIVSAILTLGFAKILIGLALPSVGLILAGPLGWLCDGLLRLIGHAASWPVSTIEVGRAPSAVWTLGAVAVMVALLAGWFARRRAAMGLAMAIVIAWLLVDVSPPTAPASAMQLHAIAVGNGSCYVARLPGGYTLLFDCGSQAYLDTGDKSVSPALRHLGVDRFDAVFVSHADFDHYNGVLDALEVAPASRVYVPPQLIDAAQAEPDSAVAFLLHQLNERGVPFEAITAGWSKRVGESKMTLLWPPPGLADVRSNDTSLVLHLAGGGQMQPALLCGDIGDDPVATMIDAGIDAAAAVCDLPHHGADIDLGAAWLDHVRPRVVLQSSGPRRRQRERWSSWLTERGIPRYVTERDGMISVTLTTDGGIDVKTFRSAKP